MEQILHHPMWRLPKIRGTYNKDYSIWGVILGSPPILGDYHVPAEIAVNLGQDVLREQYGIITLVRALYGGISPVTTHLPLLLGPKP